jgi:hypothetical protein
MLPLHMVKVCKRTYCISEEAKVELHGNPLNTDKKLDVAFVCGLFYNSVNVE